MNIYMPPQRRETVGERREIHWHVRDFLEDSGHEIISRTGGGRSLPWLRRAGAMVLETNVITKADEAECLFMADELGREVLVLFDQLHSVPGGGPSDEFDAASWNSRRSRNPNSSLWIVRHTPSVAGPYVNVDSALENFTSGALSD